ncbi:putative elongator complex protein 1 [Batrachochytrium dendrobatidis]|nr:putative elongator complex protein 1 [Batrachochytrium dendrobatidis]
MKSLTVLSEKTASLVNSTDQQLEFDTLNPSSYLGLGIAVDSDSHHVYVALHSAADSTQPNATIAIYRISEHENAPFDIARINLDSDTALLHNPTIAGMQYLADSCSLCIALHSGDIFLARFDHSQNNTLSPTVECVGIIDSGIKTMSWSPDLELVLFVTGSGTILEMTQEFEMISEAPIHVDSHGEAIPVSVGWGKKETQFHGKAGKQAAVESTLPVTDAIHISPDDTMAPSLTWRGDGNFFACSSVNESKQMRTICIYDREGVLQSTSEYVAQLEHPLCWRPSGNLIAASQRLPHRHDIVFFEKNGLRHGEFTLRNAQDIVLDLQWNSDSTVLAICVEQVVDQHRVTVVQLWVCNNYYWYLKQELFPTSTHASFVSILWDPEISTKLHVLCANGDYRRFQFSSDVLTSSSLSPENEAVVAVIDGANVLLTPFRSKNVPPPMSYSKVVLPCSAKHISFSPSVPVNRMSVLLANNTIQFWDNIHQDTASLEMIGQLVLSECEHQIRQISWVESNVLVALAYDTSLHTDRVIAYTFDHSTTNFTVIDTKEISYQKQYMEVLRLYNSISDKVLALQLLSGTILQIKKIGDSWCAVDVLTFPSVCTWMACVCLGESKDTKEMAWIGLSERNKLFLNDQILSVDCTSFLIHKEFLIITTLTHTARFLSLSLPLYEFKFDEHTHNTVFNELHRRVERGSHIIVADVSDVKLVMQMPRGNLESVFPRALVLSTIRHAIDRLDYKTAFIACRKHRIDMNFILDHAPDAFWLHIEDFVRQVDDIDHLNLFISSMRNEDVTKTMYSAKKTMVDVDVKDKVNMVCQRMKAVMDTIDATKYIQPILTCAACHQPPDIESAMRRIYTLKTTHSLSAAETALMYLIFLVDVDKLYDVALGMYDFGLVLMVAQHSQKDPREYLPFLKGLQVLPMYYQRFSIDDHLGKHASAIRNLSQAGDEHFEELIAYLKRHKLYQISITLYPKDSAKHKTMLLEFAEFHSNNGQFDEAAMLYDMAGAYPQALEAYTNAGQWQEAYTIAINTSISEFELTQMAETLIEILTERREFQSVARICLDILNDCQRAVEALVAGFFWKDAILVLTVHKQPSLKESMVYPSVIKAYDHTLMEVEEMTVTFDKQRSRLAQVRREKQRQQASAAAGGEPTDDRLDDIDMFSDTSSMATTRISGSVTNSRASMMSSRTGRTSKQRRKMARRRAAGKEPAFEDEFLIASLCKIVKRSTVLSQDISLLIRALGSFNEMDRASKVQGYFNELLNVIKRGYKEIFIVEEAQQTKDEKPAVVVFGGKDKSDAVDRDVILPVPIVIEKPPMVSDKWWTDSFSMDTIAKSL